MLGDMAYPLKEYLIRPYSKWELSAGENAFYYTLSMVRRTVECALKIYEQSEESSRKREVHTDNAVSQNAYAFFITLLYS
jgi:hypothetical protein